MSVEPPNMWSRWMCEHGW